MSEGRDAEAIAAIARAFGPGLIHHSSDPDHHRSVFTLQGEPGELAEQRDPTGRARRSRASTSPHTRVRTRAWAPSTSPRSSTCIPTSAAPRSPRRWSSPTGSDTTSASPSTSTATWPAAARAPSSGAAGSSSSGRTPARPRLHPTAGATLVAARPPLAAFNVEIDASLATAKQIAAEIRTLPGVRALGLELPTQGIVQVSTNVEELDRTTPADVVRAVRRHATVTGAELVAPAPRSAFESFPADVPLRGAPLLR